jgi:hypothetical protein
LPVNAALSGPPFCDSRCDLCQVDISSGEFVVTIHPKDVRANCATLFIDSKFQAPSGRYGRSGLGRENGKWGYAEYSEIKTITYSA